MIREACALGEGLQIEFKPFVNPSEKWSREKKTKLREVILTVVAFANANGGRIFLGVDDDGTISGIDAEYAEWAKARLDQTGIDRYIGSLRATIRDAVEGELSLDIHCTRIDGAHVVTVEVPLAINKPLQVKDDQHLYVRRDGTNRKAAPNEWKSILMPRNPLGFY